MSATRSGPISLVVGRVEHEGAAMFSRIPEHAMRWVRTGLLIAWFVLICSLLWDPLTPLLTTPDNLSSPFRLRSEPVLVQGKPLHCSVPDGEPDFLAHRSAARAHL